MQIIIYKTEILELAFDPQRALVSLGARAKLSARPDGRVEVRVAAPSRWPFGLGSEREIFAGWLSSRVANLLKGPLHRNAPLRVRVVEIEPAYTSKHGKAVLCISVWGAPEDLQPVQNRIFSDTRIHEDPRETRGGSAP